MLNINNIKGGKISGCDTQTFSRYYKWLSYIPEFEKERMENLLNKKISRLTISEAEKLQDFKDKQNMIDTLKIILSGSGNEDNIKLANIFIKKHSLDLIIYSKLTDQEKKEAHDLLEEKKNLNIEDLSNYLETLKELEETNLLTPTQEYVLIRLEKIQIRKIKDREKVNAIGEARIQKRRRNRGY